MNKHSRFFRVLFVFIFVFVALFVSNTEVQSVDYTYHEGYDALITALTNLANDHSSIAKMISLSPKTSQDRTIWAIKISDNVNSSEKENKVLYLGTHHAREWISSEVSFLLAEHLINSYSSDSTITSIIDNEEVWIVPVTNPDGYDFTDTDRLWRKNRRDNGWLCTLTPMSDGWGVDINRNYGSKGWGSIWDIYNGHFCFDDTYLGPSAFSEPETQAVRNLMNDQKFNAVLSYHSFAQLILYPWGYKKDHIPLKDYELLSSIALKMSQEISAVEGSVKYTPKQSAELYRTGGDLTDWSYEAFGIPSFTIELRPCDGCKNPGFILPADQIGPTWDENKPAAVFLANFFNLQISSPSQAKPVFAGSYNNPTKIKILINGEWRGKAKEDFTVKIGGDPASVITVTRLPEKNSAGQPQNAYELQVQPPQKTKNDKYDLEVFVGDAKATVPSGVVYGSSSSVNVVLVIDRSGSMYGQPLTDAQNAAKQFVDLMSDGDKLGVVSFSDYAMVSYQLTTLNSTEKQNAKNAINAIYALNMTSIGAGLQLAGNQLTGFGDPNSRRAIVLLSDGQENTPPYVSGVLPGIKAAGITVYTVGLGGYVNTDLMKDIASQTGGTYSFAPSSQDLVNIYNLIAAKVTGQQTILSLTQLIQQNAAVTIPAMVDTSVSEVTFSITWGGSDLDLQLTTPSGININPSTPSTDPNIVFSSGPTYEFYKVASPEAGEWLLTTTGVSVDPSGEEPFTTRVLAKTELTMDTWTDGAVYTEDQLSIKTALADNQSIVGASVIASILTPSSPVPAILALYDDGVHDDGLPDDGVYANIFTDTFSEGDYEITTSASGISNIGSQFYRENNVSQYIKQKPTITVNVIAPPDSEVAPGDSIIQIFTIENNGPQADTYDLTAGPVEIDQWADLSSIPESVTVNAYSSIQISIPLVVPAAVNNPVANTLSLLVTSQTEPLITASASTTVKVPQADLFVNVTGAGEAAAGSTVVYTVNYGNNGPTIATNIVLAIDIPAGAEYFQSSLGDPVDLSNGAKGWFVSSLESNTSNNFTIQLHILPAVNVGSILSTEVGILSGLVSQGDAPATPDSDPSNNLSAIDTKITILSVKIDIKPGSSPNSINLAKEGVIPVAILSTTDFDAPALVNRSTLTFGKTGDEKSLVFQKSKPYCNISDVNIDGINDLVCFFTTTKIGLKAGDSLAILKGKKSDGRLFTGSDLVRIVPK